MSGIYIHIPFCRKACFYCDFHFTVSLKNKEDIVKCICREAKQRKNYLGDIVIDTIYFGGGTPSVLSVDEIKQILNLLYKEFQVNKNVEITLEANPDDLNSVYLASLKNETPVNRLSIGIQSFIDKHLIWMNRRHTAEEAVKSVKYAQEAGFDNVNTDLIYGIPGMTAEQWRENLEKMFALNVQHISAYHLTIEPDTIFGRRKKKGFITEIEEELSLQHFEILLETMKKNGFDHYEISNFARQGFCSAHNLNYWNHGKYLGLGPSAHSFDGLSRQWNVKVNSEYINGVKRGEGYFENEALSQNDLYNEYVMLNLRTKWGIDLQQIKQKFGEEKLEYLLQNARKFLISGHIIETGNTLVLSERGKFISDKVNLELFFISN